MGTLFLSLDCPSTIIQRALLAFLLLIVHGRLYWMVQLKELLSKLTQYEHYRQNIINIVNTVPHVDF